MSVTLSARMLEASHWGCSILVVWYEGDHANCPIVALESWPVAGPFRACKHPFDMRPEVLR
jgi:hypothetical protein